MPKEDKELPERTIETKSSKKHKLGTKLKADSSNTKRNSLESRKRVSKTLKNQKIPDIEKVAEITQSKNQTLRALSQHFGSTDLVDAVGIADTENIKPENGNITVSVDIHRPKSEIEIEEIDEKNNNNLKIDKNEIPKTDELCRSDSVRSGTNLSVAIKRKQFSFRKNRSQDDDVSSSLDESDNPDYAQVELRKLVSHK